MQLEKLSYLTKKAAKDPNILALIIFGSHARGEEHKKSDIDLLVVVKEKSHEFEEAFHDIILEEEIGRRIVPAYTTPDEFTEDSYFTHQILKDGIILYKSPEPFSIPIAMEEKAMTVYSFNMSNLHHNQRLQLNRELYTHKHKKKIKKGSAEYEYLGLVDKIGGRKLGGGCVMVPSKTEAKIEKLFTKYNISYQKKIIIMVTET